ncbi:MAG: hypothetical protein AAF962_18935 [Actinomycetota bacterium]
MPEKYVTATVVLAVVLVFGIGIASEYGGLCTNHTTNEDGPTTTIADPGPDPTTAVPGGTTNP